MLHIASYGDKTRRQRESGWCANSRWYFRKKSLCIVECHAENYISRFIARRSVKRKFQVERKKHKLRLPSNEDKW